MRFFRRSAYALVPVVVLLAAAEGLARLVPPADPTSLAEPDGGGIMLAGNPLLAWELAPGRRREGGKKYSVNAAHFRDRERGPKSDRPRVLALGDSSVYGFGVGDDEVFTSLLERRFDAEFIDGAVPGYSTEQSLNLLSLRGFDLEPDVLLVATLWSDNNFDRFVDRDILARSRASALRWSFSGWSALAAWVERRAASRGQDTMRKVGWITEDAAHGERRVPIADYAANLGRFCALMAARGGGVVFVVLPGRDDVVDTVAAPEPWQPYRAVMRETARACDAPLVDLPAVFAEKADPALILDELHPSAAGHVLVADTIEATLRAAGWPEVPLRAHAGAIAEVPEDPFAGDGDRLFQGMHGPLREPGERGPGRGKRPGGGRRPPPGSPVPAEPAGAPPDP